MSTSEETNQATRREWRELGFYYELLEDPPRWRLVGSRAGLASLVEALTRYLNDPRNQALSEHEHYGPYMYLKIQTANSAGIDDQGIRGSLEDLARLRDLIAANLNSVREGQTLAIGQEYARGGSHLLQFEVRADDFDPAAEDPNLSEPAA